MDLPEGHRPPEDRSDEYTCHGCAVAAVEVSHHIYRGARLVRRGDGSFAVGLDGQPILEAIWEVRHVECCADNGCGLCSIKLEHAGGRRGRRLTEWLASGASSKMHAALVEAGYQDQVEA